MKHIIVEIAYKVPIEKIDEYLFEHRNFLDSGYEKNLLLASGPQNPRIGGMVIARSETIEEVKDFFREDPFYRNQCADYRFIEFIPVKFQDEFSSWFNPNFLGNK